jgi:hypothetical protein
MADQYQSAYDSLVAAMKSSPSTNLWTEPPSPASVESPPIYPYNNIQQTESGHSFEMDDTQGRERIRLQHGKSKNFIEMHPNGDQVYKVFGDGYEIIAGNKNVLIKGTCNITIAGDCNMEIAGDFNQIVKGDYNLAVAGQTNIRSHKDLEIQGDADVTLNASEKFGGSLNLGAAQSLSLGSDLYIHGSITCDSLTAESRVNAGMGVFAGPYGFTSALGGLSLGYPTPLTPVAVPGCINTVGTITSLVSVNAPIANFGLANCGIMDAVLMTDVINSLIYDSHIHPSPKGPTGPPMTQFFGI